MSEPARAIPRLSVEPVEELDDNDLAALCEATDAAIIDGGGFGWINPPGRRALESYYRGVLLVPERELIVARMDGMVVGSAHLIKPPRNNEAQSFSAQLMHAFVAPYARGHGLARMLTLGVEARARDWVTSAGAHTRTTRWSGVKSFRGTITVSASDRKKRRRPKHEPDTLPRHRPQGR